MSTYQIIVLYAYRWQIELYFRFFKRTLNGIHLWCTEPRGIEIQFYVFMIAHILILEFKQECRLAADAGSGNPSEKEDKTASPATSRENADDGRFYVCGLVTLLGDKLKKTWKIGIHWLIALKNILTEKMDSNVILFLEKYA